MALFDVLLLCMKNRNKYKSDGRQRLLNRQQEENECNQHKTDLIAFFQNKAGEGVADN